MRHHHNWRCFHSCEASLLFSGSHSCPLADPHVASLCAHKERQSVSGVSSSLCKDTSLLVACLPFVSPGGHRPGHVRGSGVGVLWEHHSSHSRSTQMTWKPSLIETGPF